MQVAMPSKQPSTLPNAVQSSSRLVGFTLSVSVKPGSSDESSSDCAFSDVRECRQNCSLNTREKPLIALQPLKGQLNGQNTLLPVVRPKARTKGGGARGHVRRAGRSKHAVGVCGDGAGARGGGDGDEGAGGAGGGVGGHAQCTGLGKHAVGVCDDDAQEKVDVAFSCDKSHCVHASEREGEREGGGRERKRELC